MGDMIAELTSFFASSPDSQHDLMTENKNLPLLNAELLEKSKLSPTGTFSKRNVKSLSPFSEISLIIP